MATHSGPTPPGTGVNPQTLFINPEFIYNSPLYFYSPLLIISYSTCTKTPVSII